MDPAAGSRARWQDVVMSGSAEDLLCLQPVCIGSMTNKANRKVGVASVFHQTGGNTQQVCSIEFLDEKTAQRTNTVVLQTGALGSVASVHASITPWG